MIHSKGQFYSKGNDKEMIEISTFIYENTDILSNQVSDTVLNTWIDKTNEAKFSANDTFFFFLDVLSAFNARKERYIIQMKDQELAELCVMWITLINMEGLKRKGLIELESFKILDFDQIKTMDKVNLGITDRFIGTFLN